METQKLYVTELDCATGIQSQREYTAEEYAAHEKQQADLLAMREQQEAEAQAKAELKASALAKLAAIGLTEEEANAITSA